MADLAMPMDEMEQDTVPAPTTEQPTTEQPQTEGPARDESGRFAPREPAGQPSSDHARRREAQERDEARQRAQTAEQERDTLKKRFEDMAAIARGEDRDAPPADPNAKLVEKLEGIDKRLTDRDEADQAAQAWRQVQAYSDADERRFVQERPDFPQATQHYIQSRMREMQAFGYSEEQAGEALANEAQALLVQCAQQGKSPAQTIYTMAEARGYTGQQGPAPQAQAQQPATVAGGRSFGTGGGAVGGGMTGAQIAQMSDDEYFAYRNTPEGKRAIARMMQVA